MATSSGSEQIVNVGAASLNYTVPAGRYARASIYADTETFSTTGVTISVGGVPVLENQSAGGPTPSKVLYSAHGLILETGQNVVTTISTNSTASVLINYIEYTKP